jgi:hypothetical protein
MQRMVEDTLHIRVDIVEGNMGGIQDPLVTVVEDPQGTVMEGVVVKEDIVVGMEDIVVGMEDIVVGMEDIVVGMEDIGGMVVMRVVVAR